MSDDAERAIGRRAAEVLRRAGFASNGVCWVRDRAPLRHFVEPQRAVYAARVTVNLGIALRTLSPTLPWVSSDRTSLMREAHRWARLDRIVPEGGDRWWDVSEPSEGAWGDLARQLSSRGLQWLRDEARPDAFLRFCEDRRRRTATELNPEGGFAELRVSIAVRCWRGEVDEAARLLEFARVAWRVEHGRLEHARRDFGESRDRPGRLPPVPDLLGEIEGLVARAASDPVA
jgi:hypothetical protein